MHGLKWCTGLVLVHLVVIACLMLLSGCGFTESGDLYRDVSQKKAAKVADQTLENAYWMTCYASSVGAVRRKYGTSQENAFIYHNFCLRGATPGASPINPILELLKEEED